MSFTSTSSCTWLGHPVSGLIHVTFRAFHTRFPFGSVPEELNLATYINSPDRSTKSTTSHFNVLCLLVNTRFQVLFHSPSGVLFTLPSQYCFTIGQRLVFRLGGWAPHFLCGLLVSADTPDPAGFASHFVYATFTLFGVRSKHFNYADNCFLQSLTPDILLYPV